MASRSADDSAGAEVFRPDVDAPPVSREEGGAVEEPDLRKRLGPTAIVALDAAGSEVGHQPTGFGS